MCNECNCVLSGPRGHMKVWYGPFGLGLGQEHGEMICMLYMYTISVHYVHVHNTESCTFTPTGEAYQAMHVPP